MCGRFNLLPDGKTENLKSRLHARGELQYARDIAPGALISIIHGGPERQISTATWWLLLDPKTGKPNYQYPSFNSRYDKLNTPGSLAYQPYRQSRCIIPASAFAEGLGDKLTYHKIEHEDQALAFGGLFRTLLKPDSGELVYSASIITLPPLDKWRKIHPKSLPLLLDVENDALVERWLDPAFTRVDTFSGLLQSVLHQPQRITPIDRPSKWNPIGDSFLLT